MASSHRLESKSVNPTSLGPAIQDPFLKAFGGDSAMHVNDAIMSRDTFRPSSMQFQSLDIDPSSVDAALQQIGRTDSKANSNMLNPSRLRFPLSPPGSTTVSPKQWPSDSPNAFSNEDFTRIQPTNPTFAIYGQMTPPDDEDESLPEPSVDHGSYGSVFQHPDAGHPFEHQSRSQHENKATSKRARKNASRGPKKHSFDSDDPNDARRSKFLERNRVAASKCRQKKKEWTQNLETRARELQAENNSLHLWLDSIRDEYMYLKTQIAEHRSCDSRAINEYLDDPKRDLLSFNNPASRNFLRSMRNNHIKQEFDETEALRQADAESGDEDGLGALLADSINEVTAG